MMTGTVCFEQKNN